MTTERYLEDDTRIDVVVLGSEALVSVFGELDIFTVDRLLAALAETEGAARVIVDFGGVTFVDCSVLRCLAQAARESAARGATLRIDHPTGVVRRLMDLMRLDDLRVA